MPPQLVMSCYVMAPLLQCFYCLQSYEESKRLVRYLILQLQRYYVDEKWCPAKLDCKVPMRPGAFLGDAQPLLALFA